MERILTNDYNCQNCNINQKITAGHKFEPQSQHHDGRSRVQHHNEEQLDDVSTVEECETRVLGHQLSCNINNHVVSNHIIHF